MQQVAPLPRPHPCEPLPLLFVMDALIAGRKPINQHLLGHFALHGMVSTPVHGRADAVMFRAPIMRFNYVSTIGKTVPFKRVMIDGFANRHQRARPWLDLLHMHYDCPASCRAARPGSAAARTALMTASPQPAS